MNKRNAIILEKIVKEADLISQLLYGIEEPAFLNSEEKMRAVCMTLINVGELIKNLDDDFRVSYSQIPWKDYAGFRDIAAHGYFTLRMDRVWLYASKEMPVFAAQIEEILKR
jgi:uncharacterized protein with HEPN domain